MTTTELLVQADRGVTTLTLNRPDKGNALSPGLVAALQQALDDAVQAGVRLLVLRGAGRHFCTGFDLSDLDAETDDSLLARFVRIELLLQTLHAAPFATLALAQGRTVGAGADLFAACAARWVVDEASFAFPGAGFGIVLGTGRLADSVGDVLARDWVGSGRRVALNEASAAGLVQRLLAPQDVDSALAAASAAATRLDAATQAGMHAATAGTRRPRGSAGNAADLLLLVRSAARQGLQARIAAYRTAMLGPR